MPTPTAIKFADGSDVILDILAIPYGGPLNGRDTDGEYFSAKTDLCEDWFPREIPLLFEHGLDDGPGVSVIGRVDRASARKTDDGVWVQAQLDKANRYHARIKQLIEAGTLYGSSGAMPHLVQRGKGGHIERWPWVELSLTPQPANLLAEVAEAEVAKHYKSAGLELDTDALKARLDAAERNRMDDSDFAYIDAKGGRHLPIHDAAHVRNAVARFNQTQFESAAAKRTAAGRIRAAAKKFGISLSPDDLKSVAGVDLDFLIGAASLKALMDALGPDGSVSAGEPNGDAPEGSYEDLIEDLNRAVQRAMPDGYGYVVATFPSFCIVRCCCDDPMFGGGGAMDDDDSPAYYRYDYTVGEDGEPVLGAATPMEKRYVPTGKSADPPFPQLASAALYAAKTIAAVTERTRDVQERRAADGRTLSQASRRRLDELVAATKAECAALEELLASMEPAAKADPAEMLRRLELRHRALAIQRPQ